MNDRDRQRLLAAYATPSWRRGSLDVATSLLPYLALSVATYFTLGVSPFLTAGLLLLAGGFLVRVFIVFHDCTHGSMFPSRRANQWVGTLTGLMVLSPFARWRHDHAVHHATAGDLDRRGVGDIVTLTIAEYEAKTWKGRLGYRFTRHPIVMFGLGPIFAMVVRATDRRQGCAATNARERAANGRRVAGDRRRAGPGDGLGDFLLVWAPSAMFAGSVGIWLFYVQHQFEDAYWQSTDSWSYAEAALRGSSYLKLPKVLQFFTGNIGLHHVHHLNARIPNYNLQRAHDSHEMFAAGPDAHPVGRPAAPSGSSSGMSRAGKLVTFAQARHLAATAPRAVTTAAAGAGA